MTPLPLEYVGVSPVIVKPASAIGEPLLSMRSNVYVVLADGENLSIWFEYEAADCQVEFVAADVGHMPPKTYMSVSDAFACTSVEKLNPLDRNSAPSISAEVTSLAVVAVSSAHVPLPVVLVSIAVNLHNAALEEVEQEPA
jgi:hypothetical protein